MLTTNDLNQIQGLFNNFWDDVLEPAFNNIHENFATKRDLEKLEAKVNLLPTKSYIDDKFADFKRDYLLKK